MPFMRAKTASALEYPGGVGDLEQGQETGASGSGLTPDENNLLHQMWKKVTLDEEFCQNYEKWLEDEIWGYYD